MTSITFRVVAKTLFDAEVAGDIARIAGAFDTGIEEIARRIRRPVPLPDRVPTPGNLRYRRAVTRMDRLVYRIIEEHRDGRDRGDLLSALMRIEDEEGRPMSERQLRDETITMLLADTRHRAASPDLVPLSGHPESRTGSRTKLMGGRSLGRHRGLPRLHTRGSSRRRWPVPTAYSCGARRGETRPWLALSGERRSSSSLGVAPGSASSRSRLTTPIAGRRFERALAAWRISRSARSAALRGSRVRAGELRDVGRDRTRLRLEWGAEPPVRRPASRGPTAVFARRCDAAIGAASLDR